MSNFTAISFDHSSNRIFFEYLKIFNTVIYLRVTTCLKNSTRSTFIFVSAIVAVVILFIIVDVIAAVTVVVVVVVSVRQWVDRFLIFGDTFVLRLSERPLVPQ